MGILDIIFKENETKALQHDQFICEKILKELEVIYQTHSVEFEENMSVDMILSFFKLYGNTNFRNLVYELMEKNHFNKRSFLFHLISEIYPPDFLDECRVLTNCLDLEEKSDHYELKTSFGTLELYRLTDKILNPHAKYILQRQYMHRRCHVAVETFAPFFPDDVITTSKLDRLFGGKHYHSYIALEDGSGIMDVSRNTFFRKDCFDKVFKPEIVLQYKASELKERFQEFEENCPNLVNEFSPVLQLALKEEVKRNGKRI